MHGWIKNKKEVQFIRQNIPLKFIQDTSLNLPASYLSSGLQKKIQIINRLYSKPKILLWDQPDLTNEINSNVDIKELMEEYIKAGLSVIISSNDIKELSNLCHRIYEFDNGILTESSMYLTI
jgi:ABC-type sugar transport system ATPase subunit